MANFGPKLYTSCWELFPTNTLSKPAYPITSPLGIQIQGTKTELDFWAVHASASISCGALVAVSFSRYLYLRTRHHASCAHKAHKWGYASPLRQSACQLLQPGQCLFIYTEMPDLLYSARNCIYFVRLLSPVAVFDADWLADWWVGGVLPTKEKGNNKCQKLADAFLRLPLRVNVVAIEWKRRLKHKLFAPVHFFCKCSN